MALKETRQVRGLARSFADTEKHGFVLELPLREEEMSQASACWRKVFYGTEAKAKLAAQSEKVTTPQEPYPCVYCGGWHLASVRKKRA